MAPTVHAPTQEETKAAPQSAPSPELQPKNGAVTDIGRSERDSIRSANRGGSIMDAVTATTSTGNDHHEVAHTNFQKETASNVQRNQQNLDQSWTKGTELGKEYGRLLALDAAEAGKPENLARRAEVEKQIEALKGTVSGIAGADHPITQQFSQHLQNVQDQERSKVVADKLWSLTTEAEMFSGLKRGRELEKAIVDYKERNRDLFEKSAGFAETIKNQDQKAREHGGVTRKQMEERYKELADSLDDWRPNKAEVAQSLSSIGSRRNFELVQAIYREGHAQKGRPELFDLVKDKCGANSDAARSFYTNRSEYKFAHRIDDARAERLFTGVNEAELSKDPRFAAAKGELERLRTAIYRQRMVIGGNEKDSELRLKEYEEQTAPGLANFWSTVSGARGVSLKMSEASQTLANQQIASKAQLERDLAEQTKRYEAMIQAETAGRQLQGQGKVAEAQEQYNKAQLTFVDFAKGSGRQVTLVTQEYAAQQGDALDQLARAEVIMDRSETALRATKKVCVVAGATVATIATAGAGAPLLVAAATGTAAGASIGTASNVVEGTGDVAYGNKSVGDAAKYVVVESLKDTKSAAVAGVSTAAGIGVAKYVRGGAESVSLLRSVSAGSAAGATAAGVTTTVDMGGERLIAEYNFKQEMKGQNLTPEERLLQKTRYMEEHGVSGKQILVNGAVNMAVGTISGGIGGGSAHVTGKIANAASKTIAANVQQVAVQATEQTANAGMALGAAYVLNGGHLDLNSTIQILGNAAVADGMGRHVAAAPKTGATSAPATAPAAHEPAAVAAPKPAEPTVIHTQQNGNTTTVTVGTKTTQPTVTISGGEATTTASSGTTTTVRVAQSEPATAQPQQNVGTPQAKTQSRDAAPTGESIQNQNPKPETSQTQTSAQQPATAASPKETALLTKSAENTKLIEFQEKFIDYTKKLAAEGKITPEQAENGIKDCNEKLANLRKEQAELARDIESERTTQRLMAETRQMNQERAQKVRLEIEETQAAKAKIHADFLEQQRAAAEQSKQRNKPLQDQVVAEAQERMAARDNEVRRQVASREEAKRAEIARRMNLEQAIAEGRLPAESSQPSNPQQAAAAPKPQTSSTSGGSTGSGSASPSPGGGTKEVLVAKIQTEEVLQRTADGRAVPVQKQKVVYVAEAEPEVSPQQAKVRADLEKMLNAAPKEAPKSKLTHADEQSIYHDIEAKSSAAADELFVTRRNANGKFLTKEDVIEVCAKYKIDPPESIQPKPAAAPEVEVTKAPKERETVEAKRSQRTTDLPDESIESNYFEVRRAAEHNERLAAKLDALHDKGEFTARKVGKAFRDAGEEIPEIVLDRSQDSDILPKPWSPDTDDSFSPSPNGRGRTATLERTETKVATRTRPVVESEEQTQTRTATKPRVVEEEQTASARAKPEEETQSATRTSTKTKTQTEEELQTQPKAPRKAPPKEPPPPPPNSSRREGEEDYGHGKSEYKRREQHEEEIKARRAAEERERAEKHSVKHDWVEEKGEESDPFSTGRRGRFEDRGF